MRVSFIKAIAKKELIMLRRDKRLIGLIVMMPLFMLFVFGYALKLEPNNVKMALVDKDHTFFSDQIKTALWSDGYFELYEVESKADIINEIRAGRARAGLYIPEDFADQITLNKQPHVTLFVDGTMPSLTTAMKSNSGTITDDGVTSSMYFFDDEDGDIVIADDPFIKDTEVLFNPDEKETWFFLPGVIGVLIMQIALILTGTSVVREREKHTLEQLLVAPISKAELVIGKLLPYIIIALLDFYLILAMGHLLFDLPNTANPLLLFLLALIFVSVMIAMGLLISIVTQTQQQAMFLAIFILIPSVLLSGMIFPLEAVPEMIRPICYLLPFTYFIEIIRSILIKGTDIIDLLPYYGALIAYLLFFVTISTLKFRRNIG